ncbi:MAG TPA: His/Gly/Thr/Pro-type tRNA ligase C-terminal domain-containing protein, partial [Candidatus Binatia bacterium]|nr:His/Gly/Thr/Pro-type tRNA ligase C-terminal domain-containing protein [Candidatus Binatia bacterium]
LVTAVVRGDFEVNETKLMNAVKAVGGLRPATAEEIRAAGMEPGYASPVGAHDTTVVVDSLAAASPNLVAGANRPGVHLRNVNVGRDFEPDLTTDIANAREGDPCPECDGAVRLAQGIEVGNIFKLGSDFTVALDATFLAEDGSRHHPVMGSYGIGLGRALACIVEAHHDEKGIAWPVEVAPYRVHLVSIGAQRDPAIGEQAEALYARLQEAGITVLFDDRDESPGVKFTDAELLGMPTIVTVSPRSLAAGGAEVTDRASGERSVRPIDDLVAELTAR